ncbi:MAG TPA: hypothetical protein VFU05_02080 [Cyclobacteriaceae bacterium]|nr:hypothetical protein [Cyclobacteriaceae bacterium]
MLIRAETLQHWINHFYGYGSWNAPFWFVGYEESGGDLPEEVAEKLNYFYKVHAPVTEPTLCDIRELYREVVFRIEGPRAKKFANFHDHRFGPDAVLHGFWKNLIAFKHSFQNKKLPDPLTYQQEKFASSSSQEALIQLYPLPAHSHAWYYGWLDLPQFPFLKSRASYQQHVYQQRVSGIFNQMKSHKPELVLMFGMDNIINLKSSALEFFPSAKFKTMKAVKQVTPQYHVANCGGTILLITTQIPGLHHNRPGTGFDWEQFGKSVRSSV